MSSPALAAIAAGVLLAAAGPGCGREGEMRDSVQMADTTQVMRALRDPASRDALLDTMPGGEMARGDSAAERTLLESKM